MVSLLLVIVLGVALVVLLITWVKVPAFVGLLLGSLFVGLAARMPLADIPRAFQQGVGDTLGFTAIVIGLGTVIGKLLAESGGAIVVARAVVTALGERRLEWAIMLAALIIGLPVFFQVGLVLLAPVLFTLVHETKAPVLLLGIPMLAGLAAAHGLVPPHPGPLAAIERLGADPGRTLFYSLIVSLPVAVIAGPIFGRFITKRVQIPLGPLADQFVAVTPPPRTPSLGVTLTTILLPVILMLLAALAQQTMADGSVRRAIAFVGSPLVAMLVATVLSMWTFGLACGFDRGRILRLADESLGPIAGVLLVVGAGGGFGRVLVAAGADSAITHVVGQAHLSPLDPRLSHRGAAAAVGRVRHRGNDHDRERHGAGIVRVGARESGSARPGDRRGLQHRVACERRRLLAGQGVLQHERRRDRRDVDDDGNGPVRHGARRHSASLTGGGLNLC